MLPARPLACGALLGSLALALGCSVDAAERLAACPERACQAATSLTAKGACVYEATADGAACQSSLPCMATATCVKGLCQGEQAAADNTPCDDDNLCTQGDVCQAGTCVGTPISCGESGTCQSKATCDPAVGCVASNVGPCVDGLVALPLTGCPLWTYAAPVQVGPTTYSLLLDSGSTTTAVASVSCSNCGALSPTYAGTSSTESQHASTTAGYADGSAWQAGIYSDLIGTGANAAGVLGPVVRTRFAAITAQAGGFFGGFGCAGTSNLNGYQGIWGLGPAAGARLNTDGFLDQLQAANVLPHDAFSVQLCPLGGRFWLGGYSPAAAAGAVEYTPLLHGAAGNDNFYTVAVTDMALGGAGLGVSSYGYGPAIVDTGSTGLSLPPAAYASLTSMLAADANAKAVLDPRLFAGNSAGDRYAYPGRNDETPSQVDARLPWLRITLPRGGPSAPFALLLAPTHSYLAVNKDSASASASYLYTFAAYPSDRTLFGTTVMQSHVLVFDREGDRLGFVAEPLACPRGYPIAQ